MAISTSGNPRGVIWKDVGIASITNLITEQTLFSGILPGGTLNLANKLTFLLAGGLSTALLPGSLTIRVKYGNAVSIVNSGALTLLASANDAPYKINGFLTNKSATNQQYLQNQLNATTGGISLANGMSLGHARPAVDSTADQVFAITAQFSSASANNILTVDYLEVAVNS